MSLKIATLVMACFNSPVHNVNNICAVEQNTITTPYNHTLEVCSATATPYVLNNLENVLREKATPGISKATMFKFGVLCVLQKDAETSVEFLKSLMVKDGYQVVHTRTVDGR